MTVPPDEGQPLTRRELRERERRAAASGAGAVAAATHAPSRRAATASVTQAGAMPVLTATQARRIDEPGLLTSQLPVIIPEGSDRPLTRRELRALLAQQEAQRAAGEIPALAGADDSRPAEPVADPDVVAPVPEDRADDADAERAVETPAGGAVAAPAVVERPALDTALFSAVGTGTAGVVEEKATEITGSFEPPVEHLHITEELDNKAKVEADASFDDLIARGVASTGAVTTTNALVMPTTPTGPAVAHADSDDVLVTGSIDMPRSLGSTGQHPNLYDSPEVDRYLDRIDREQAPADSVPVSASSAISSHSATPGMIAPQRSRGVTAPVVLAITAAVLLVGAIVLFVGGFILDIF